MIGVPGAAIGGDCAGPEADHANLERTLLAHFVQRESDLRLCLDFGSFRWLPSDVFGPGKAPLEQHRFPIRVLARLRKEEGGVCNILEQANANGAETVRGQRHMAVWPYGRMHG
jgi:hypothetical protein